MSVWRRILTTFPVHDRFWQNADQLVAEHEVIIDRPAGSHHPRFPEICYPLDYGCLAGTTGGDGQGIDVWFGTLPGVRVTGAIMTIDLRKKRCGGEAPGELHPRRDGIGLEDSQLFLSGRRSAGP